MILYLIFMIVALICALLFTFNKYPLKSYTECKASLAKNAYRFYGLLSCYILTLGFLFMALYDLSINKSNEMIVLEGFGLAFLLAGVILIVFGVIDYHNKLNDYKRELNDNSNKDEIIKDCENMEEK